MPKTEPKAIEKLNYEEAFSELEVVIAALESGEHPLEESITLFERGQALGKRCAELLDQADLRVQVIVGDSLSEFKESA